MENLEKRRVLVVDDQPNVTDLVRLFLEKTNRYSVFVQNCSSRAMESARDCQPDLIILDVDMPGQDGGDVASELKLTPQFSRTPILFFTSLISSAESKGQVIERGGEKFLAKPIHARGLVEAVDRTLGPNGSC